MLAEQLIQLHPAHLRDVLLQINHQEQTPKFQSALCKLSILVFPLGCYIQVTQDIELLLLLLKVLIAEIRAKIVLHVTPANHTHQS